MKLKNKGKKIFPSPSSSSSSAASSAADVPSILKLLPTAILALATVLSLEDREVLAYMITMSLKSTSSSSSAAVPNKKPAKKSAATGSSNPPHKGPMFGCDCFDCYTSYWFRWDSSPNRELIHQAIEAFEEHLLSSEQQKSSSGSKKKKIRDKKEKTQLQLLPLPPPPSPPPPAASDEAEAASSSPLQQISISPTQMAVEPEIHEVEEKEVALASPAGRDCGGGSGGGVGRKGIVRKVLPDVLGLLNSRLWSLWGPNL